MLESALPLPTGMAPSPPSPHILQTRYYTSSQEADSRCSPSPRHLGLSVLIYKMIVSSSSGNKIAMNSALEILMQKTDEHGSGLFESGEDAEHREKGTQSLQYSFQCGAW